jgi:hypothetical protein
VKIPAGYSELIDAFRRHTQEMDNCDGPSRYLLYFYAVECGLKHLLVKRNKFRRTDELRENYGHDLRKMLKALKVSKTMIRDDSLQQFHLNRDRGRCYDIREVHQAWRYGITVKTEDENRIVSYFDRVTSWIKGAI